MIIFKKKGDILATHEWLEKRASAWSWLKKTFPESIGVFKPLKVGILNDLRQIELDDKPAFVRLRQALYLHTSRVKYLNGLVCGANRVDLSGNVVAQVSDEEDAHAKERLKEITQKIKSNRQKKKDPKKEENIGSKMDDIQQVDEKINPITGRKILSLKKKLPA